MPSLEFTEEWQYKWLLRKKLLLCSLPHRHVPCFHTDNNAGDDEGGRKSASAGTEAVGASSTNKRAEDGVESTSAGEGSDEPGVSNGLDTLAASSAKRRILLDILSHCKRVKGAFNQRTTFTDALRMIQCNLFRPLRLGCVGTEYDDDEDAQFLDPDWPHISIVYELLLTLV